MQKPELDGHNPPSGADVAALPQFRVSPIWEQREALPLGAVSSRAPFWFLFIGLCFLMTFLWAAGGTKVPIPEKTIYVIRAHPTPDEINRLKELAEDGIKVGIVTKEKIEGPFIINSWPENPEDTTEGELLDGIKWRTYERK